MIPDLTAAPTTDPLEIYRYRDGLYAVDLLTAAAVHLDFFSWLAANPSSFGQICAKFGFADRPADVMLTLFTADGFIEARAGVFHVTTKGREHLCKESPWNLVPYFASLKDRPVALDYLKVLTTGKPANWGGAKEGFDWHKAMETDSFARSFTAAMDCRGIYLARSLARAIDLSGTRRLLDIGGGSGIYACSLCAHFPKLSAVLFDQSPVDRIAAKLIEERGLAGRVTVQAGNFFADAWPSDCDAHLFSNVLHDWDVTEVRELLKRSAAALPAGGLLVIHDAFINAEKTGPLPVARYSALLMHSTQGKCYSTAEYEAFAREFGFGEFHYQPTAADRGVMTSRKRA
jgi:predicted O-methyltransferase YrrM